MSFADPSTVTVNAVAVPLPRTSTGPNSSTYTSADSQYQLTVSHAYGKRNRRTIRLTQTKLVADPIVPAQSVQTSMSCYMVVDVPKFGLSNTEQKYIVDALTGFLAATSGAQVTKIIGGEN